MNLAEETVREVARAHLIEQCRVNYMSTSEGDLARQDENDKLAAAWFADVENMPSS